MSNKIKKMMAVLVMGVILVLPFAVSAAVSITRIRALMNDDSSFAIDIMTKVVDLAQYESVFLPLVTNQNFNDFTVSKSIENTMKLANDSSFVNNSAVQAAFNSSEVQGLVQAKINQLGANTPSGIVPCDTKASGYAECNICHLFVGVKSIVDYIVYATMPLAAGMLVYGGILMITSGASEKNVSAGQNILWKAFIGMLVVFGAWIIVDTAIKILAAQNSAAQVGYIENWGPWNSIPECSL